MSGMSALTDTPMHGGRREGAGRKAGPLGRATALAVRIPVSVLAALDAEAAERGVSRSRVVADVLTRSMRARGRLC